MQTQAYAALRKATIRRALIAATALTSVSALPAYADVTLSGSITNQVDLDSLQTGGGIATATAGTVIVGLGSTDALFNGTTVLIGPAAVYSGAAASGPGVQWNFTNAGVVSGDLSGLANVGTTAPNTAGVFLGGGSTVVNQNGALITGAKFGIALGGGASTSSVITNNGAIVTYLGLATGTAAVNGGTGIFLLGPGSVTNTGTILTGANYTGSPTATTSGLGNGLAIVSAGGSVIGPSTVTNSGAIFGAIALTSDGTITNTGQITTALGGVSIARTIQVAGPNGALTVSTGAGTVSNSGEITTTTTFGVRAARVSNSQGAKIVSSGSVYESVPDRNTGDGVFIAGGFNPSTSAAEINTLFNAGEITGATTGVYFGSIITQTQAGPLGSPSAYGTVLNESTGRITGAEFGINASDATIIELINRGTIQGTIGALLSHHRGDRIEIENSGQILGSSLVVSDPLTADFIDDLDDSSGAPPVGIGLGIGDYGQDDADGDIVIDNVTGGVISGGYAGIAGLVDDLATSTANPARASILQVNNSGTVAATNAGVGVFLSGSGTVTNNTGGVITGKAFATDMGTETLGIWMFGRGAVTNAGTINGHVRLGSSGSTMSNSGTLNLAAGTEFGTTRINGTFTNTSTGKIIIKVNESDQSDKIVVTGAATLQGGTVSVVAPDGTWDVNHTYTILSATGGVSGTFAGADINQTYLTPVLAYSANAVNLTVGRLTAAIQEDIISETTEQQVSSSSRRVAAAIDGRVDQAVSAAFISLPGLQQRDTAMLQGEVTGLSAGDSSSAMWGTWATFAPTFLRQNLILPGSTTTQKVTGTSLSFLAGVDRVVGSRTVLGAFASYESSDYDIKGTVGERKGKGPVAGAYAGVVINDWSYASLQINNAWLTNRLREATFGVTTPVTGKFDSSRFMASSTVTAYKVLEKVKVSGKVAYSYTYETFDAYTSSDGTAIAPNATRLGRVSTGGEIAGTGKTFLPYLQATYEWDVSSNGAGDKNGAVVGGGLRYIRGAFSFDVYGSSQLARSQERAYSAGLNARFAF